MTTWYKQAIKCNTHGWVNGITESETLITKCPLNESDTVNTSSAYIVDTLSDNKVRILQESGKTNGYYSCHGKSFLALGCCTGATAKVYDADGTLSAGSGDGTGRTTHNYFRFEMPFTVLTGLFQSRSGMDRDMLNLRILPQNPVPVGILTQDVVDDATLIHVNSTTLAMIEADFARVYLLETATGRVSEKVEIASSDIANGILTLSTPLESQDGNGFPWLLPNGSPGGTQVILLSNICGVMTTANTLDKKWITISSSAIAEFIPGRWVNIFRSASNKSELRMIEALDLTNNRIRIDEPFNVAMDPAAAPVYIQLTIKTVNNVTIKDNSKFNLGQSVIGGSYIRQGIAIVFDYTRKQTTPIEVDYEFEIFC